MGEVFAGRYELLEPVAEGGMGAVWTVCDHSDGSVKAAKLLRHSDAGSLLRFMREQSTRIHHPHVVTPLSWAGEDDTVLFTMPLIGGGSVGTLVGDWGPLPEQWAVTVLDQALAALEAVHSAGVVHRDVKPANLLLEPTGPDRPHVRLSDFGIAAAVDQPRLTEASGAVGTPGYAAPDQLSGAHPDPRQDLYAVAVVGLEMLVGHPPPFTVEELPVTALGRLLASAMNPDPQQRPASAAELRERLRDWYLQDWEPGGVEVLEHLDASGAPTTTGRRTSVLAPRPARTALPPPPASTPAPAPASAPRPGLLVPALLALVGIGLLTLSLVLVLG